MNAPKFTFSEKDNTLGVGNLAKGISGFQGKFLSGPFAKPDEVIYNWQQFVALYGGFSSDSTDPILVFRALDSGANLRISRIGHYDDLTDQETLTAEKAELGICHQIVLNKDSSTGSVFTAILNGNNISVENTTTHEEFMQEIADALTIEGLSFGSVFKIGDSVWGINVSPTTLTVLSFNQAPAISGTINGPSESAQATVVPTASPAEGTVFTLMNVTKGHTLATYTSQAGDSNSVVAAALRGDEEYAGYNYSGSGSNIIVDAPTINPYATAYNGDVLQLQEVNAGTPETRAQVEYTIAVGGAIGEVITIENGAFGLNVDYTIQAGIPTYSGMAAVINTGVSGCQAYSIGSAIIIQAPEGYGDLANGEVVTFSTSGAFEIANPTDAMSGGVTGVAPSNNTVSAVFSGGANGGTGNPTVTVRLSDGVDTQGGIEAFRAVPKSEGYAGNFIVLHITNASNGFPAYFNMTIENTSDSTQNETYQNLLMDGFVNIEGQSFLNSVIENSNLLDFEYIDLSALSSSDYPRPVNCQIRFRNGYDGDAIEISDYIGTQVGETGFHAFNKYNDMMQFCAGEVNSMELHEAACEYAEQFKNMVYIGHIDHNLTYTQMVAAMEASSIDTSWAAFYTGGLKVKHPSTGVSIQISEIGDVLGAFATSDTNFGEWAAVFNKTRGRINKTQGVIKNFGGESNYEILNLLANNRINTVITEDGITMMWGNTTAQRTTSVLQFLNIRRLGLYIKKILSPIMKEYLSEPNIPNTWFDIFVRVTPFLDGLVQKQALYTYTWKGDQLANPSLNNLVVNQPLDVQAGKYKAILSASAVPGMNEFDLVLTYDFTNGTVDIQTP